MKQGKLLTRVLMILLILAIAAYVGTYLWKSVSNPFRTVMAYTQTVNDSEAVTGLLVRDETLISGTGVLVEPLFDDGVNVAAGETVELLYANEDALSRKQQIDVLERQRDLLTFALSGSSVSDVTKLDDTILDAVRTIRSATASGDLTDLEDDSLTLRSLILKRSYAYSGSGSNTTEIQSQIDSCTTQINQLSAQAFYDTTSVTAPCSGLFSSVTDGYENLITVDQLESLTVEDLQSLSTQTVTVNSGGLGKIIQGIKWYFAAVMDEASAARLGGSATLIFSQDFSGTISMDVERIGAAEDGKCVVIFSSDRYLAETSLLRNQTVDLVFHEYTGIRVPTAAVRLDADGQAGVYTVSGIQAEFKPVNIIYSGEGYYLLSPLDTEEDTKAGTCLRAGDEIIIAAADLYDGKIVG